MLPIFQIFGEDIDHRSIEWYDQRLSVFRNVDVHHIVIEIEVLDLNMHKTSLSDTRAEKEIRHHPALIFCKGAFFDVWFLQKQLQLILVIGFNWALVRLDCLHLEVWQIALIHKEMQGRYEISQIGIDTCVIIESCF